MDKGKGDLLTWKLILKCILGVALALGICFGFPFLLVMLWAVGNDAKYEKLEPEALEAAQAYLTEQYPGNDFEITKFYHNFKDNSFDAEIQSCSSADTHFTVKINDTTLEPDYDGYEWNVLNRGNTAARISEDYEIQVEAVLNTLPGIDWVSAGFVRYSRASSASVIELTVGLDTTTLELDGEYDAAVMGWDHGELEVWFVEDAENLNLQRLLERLREVDAAMTQAGIGYRLVEIWLVDKPDWEHTREYYIYDILRENLNSENPEAILQAMWEEQEAKRQALKEQWDQSGNN